MRSVIFFSGTILLTWFWSLPVDCTIKTYITYKGGVVLLGHEHPFSRCPMFDSDHLQAIIKQISDKKKPCTLLVEDFFASIQKKLKHTSSEYLKISLMQGLIQRINVIAPTVRTINLARGRIVARALFFTKHSVDCPMFFFDPPKKLNRNHVPDAYTHRFCDLIAEVTQLKEDLFKRRRADYKQCVHEFIDSMTCRIDEQLARLNMILANQHIDASASILATTVHWWVLCKMALHKEKVDELLAIDHDFHDFAQASKAGMTDEEWRCSSKDLEDRCRQLFALVPELPPAKPSFKDELIKKLSTIRTWFAKPQEESVASLTRELVTLADPSRDFHDQSKELHDCFLQLRLLLVDSHATLDIIDNLGTEITVIAGDLHIKNITQYLSSFGLEQTDNKVGDISKNEEPLDLNALLI